MPKTSNPLCVAIDGGTTNTRARLFRDSGVIGCASRAVGVRNVAVAGSAEPLRRAVADCIAELIQNASVTPDQLDLVCASGMLTSNVGLREVPHVVAPAGIDDLARHVVPAAFPEIVDSPIHLIPGIKTIPPALTIDSLPHMDMLRGEESETFGILESTGERGPLTLLLPGSHTKLLEVDAQNRIARSYTTIAGELMQALAERTILASSVEWPPPGEMNRPALEAGGRFAREWGVLRGAFAVRLAHVIVGLDRAASTWFFIGLVVGGDLADLTRSSLWSGTKRVLVGGREPQRSAYGHLLHSEWRVAAEILDESFVDLAASLGAIAIARRFLEIHPK